MRASEDASQQIVVLMMINGFFFSQSLRPEYKVRYTDLPLSIIMMKDPDEKVCQFLDYSPFTNVIKKG
jgi:hypothetical protein